MPWREQTPQTVNGVILTGIELTAGRDLLCRGECEPFPDHTSSLGRACRNASTLFKRYGEYGLIHLFVNGAPPLLAAYELEYLQKRGVLGAMVLMQQHRAPTRLLDWSHSFWVALYFAVIDNEQQPGVVWCVDNRVRVSLEFKKSGDPSPKLAQITTVVNADQWTAAIENSGEWLATYHAWGATPRIAAQQSVFSIANPFGVDHMKYLEDLMPDAAASRVIISPALKRPLVAALRGMGITGQSLFPGTDGLGRRLRETVCWGLNIPAVTNDPCQVAAFSTSNVTPRVTS